VENARKNGKMHCPYSQGKATLAAKDILATLDY